MDRPTIVILGFHQTFERNPATDTMDRPVDWVTYAPVHAVQSTKIVDRVDLMRPPEFVKNDDEGKKMDFLRFRWEMIERAWKAWKEGIEVPDDGTPLGSWPGLNAAQVNAFRSVGAKTVEAVAAMSDAVIGKVPLPGVREIKRQAALFIEHKSGSALAARQAEAEDKIKALEEQLAAAMELLEEQAKPKRGRPPKTVAAVEDEAA